MSMSAFTQHDVGGPPAVLDSQEAVLLELLSAAGREPVSYGELQEAGIELPASMVSELELAGVSIVRCFLGEARGVGVRLERPSDARRILVHTAEAAGSPAANPVEGERMRDHLMRVTGSAVGRGWAAVTALIAWTVCIGLPVTIYAVRRLLCTSRAAGEWAHRRAQHALSTGVRRAREAAVAIAAWLARVVPPATGAATASSTAYPLGPPLEATARLSPRAGHRTRNRCLAFSALVAVSGVVLAVVLSNLGASAGGTRRFQTHRHNSGLALPNAARRAPAVRTTGTTQ